MVTIALLYNPSEGHPFRIATIGDRALAIAVAKRAVYEAEIRAASLDEVDPVLGAVEQEETAKLRRVIDLVLPEANTDKVQPAALM